MRRKVIFASIYLYLSDSKQKILQFSSICFVVAEFMYTLSITLLEVPFPVQNVKLSFIDRCYFIVVKLHMWYKNKLTQLHNACLLF